MATSYISFLCVPYSHLLCFTFISGPFDPSMPLPLFLYNSSSYTKHYSFELNNSGRIWLGDCWVSCYVNWSSISGILLVYSMKDPKVLHIYMTSQQWWEEDKLPWLCHSMCGLKLLHTVCPAEVNSYMTTQLNTSRVSKEEAARPFIPSI